MKMNRVIVPPKFFALSTAFFLIAFLAIHHNFSFFKRLYAANSHACAISGETNLDEEVSYIGTSELLFSQTENQDSSLCARFLARERDLIYIELNFDAYMKFPGGTKEKLASGMHEILLPETGTYTIESAHFKQKQSQDFPDENLEIQVKLIAQKPDENLEANFSSIDENSLQNEQGVGSIKDGGNFPSSALVGSGGSFWTVGYNVSPPPFQPADLSPNLVDRDLQKVVDKAVLLLKEQEFPIDSVSISLINLNSEVCCDYAGFQDKKARYPASLSKLFWIVMLKAKQSLPNTAGSAELLRRISAQDEFKMLHESDNNAASNIVDAISNTVSSKEYLSEASLSVWLAKRLSINSFFEQAGYHDINVSQKTFPIPGIDISEPVGPDLQMRSVSLIEETQPQRNHLTSFEVSRLLYEIAENKAISEEVSFEIKGYLFQDHNSEELLKTPYNPIKGFFGEGLPAEANLFTKIGYTTNDGRQEAAIIESKDQSIRFVLVVFANDPIFSSETSKALPQVVSLIYSQLSAR